MVQARSPNSSLGPQEGFRQALDLEALKAHLERRQTLAITGGFFSALATEADYQVARQSQGRLRLR